MFTSIQKSKADNNQYFFKTLRNGLKVLLVSNPEFTKSSCALTVKKGTYSNPEEFPGLAHFVEHMLFMGSQKYPDINEFEKFLSMHNGYTNAYTDNENTAYYCDIESKQLPELASMFLQFFVSPLFDETAVEKEICAVNSEYLNEQNSTFFRFQALVEQFMADDAIEARFACGNEETLRKENIVEEARRFWRTEYSSNLMSLVICGNHSIKKLEKVADYFEEIQNLGDCHAISAVNSNYYLQLFKPDSYSKVVQFKPLDNNKELKIVVTLPGLRNEYKKNALSYISFLFGKKEKGSIYSMLKQEGLAFDIKFEFLYYERFTIVKIDVGLTNRGFDEYKTILNMISGFLKNMKANQVEYERLARIEKEEFEFEQTKTPIEITESLCSNLLFFPPENVLNWYCTFDDFDASFIDDCIDKIADYSRWLIFISNPNGSFDKKEKYFNVEYAVSNEKVQINPIQICNAADNADDDLAASIEVLKEGQDRYMKKETFKNGEIVFVFDQKFNIPKSNVFVILSSDEIKRMPLIYKVFFTLVEDQFEEVFARNLKNNHLELSIVFDNTTGVILQFEGFSHKMLFYINEFFKIALNFDLGNVTNKRFEVIKQSIINEYSNTLTESPSRRTFSVFRNKLTGSKMPEELLEEAMKLQICDVNVSKNFYTQLVAVGNLRFSDVKNLFDSIAQNSEKPVLKLDSSVDNVQFITNDQNNNAVCVFYKVNSLMNETENCLKYNYNTAVARLIHQIIDEKFFNNLRTEETFGYVVSSYITKVLSAEYLYFVVQSEKTVDVITARILSFVSDIKDLIAGMDIETFEAFKESLISSYEEPILNLEELASFVYNRVTNENVDMDYYQKMVSIVKSLEKEDLLQSNILKTYITVTSKKDISL